MSRVGWAEPTSIITLFPLPESLQRRLPNPLGTGRLLRISETLNTSNLSAKPLGRASRGYNEYNRNASESPLRP